MNGLIEKLAEKAGCAWWEGNAQRDMTRCQDELEKFAQLIVKECTNIVLHYTNVDEGVAVAKKHFGVE